ncbi:hypothetical protein NW768_007957 [Fusarium equiseti]|uniref:Uncharacterized protein n=1 Tax=Fusarium equiseti TaxID=61235 RepID=A0ABQ8R5R1_FUSEQ|nr:hypothetical protein NW768_007957 [Fusarium equiseti]
MCQVNQYECGCCQVVLDWIIGECQDAPKNITECKNYKRTIIAGLMYCESCGEAFPFDLPRWYRYPKDPILERIKAEAAARHAKNNP